uniref:Uncharacterized protein n=1 Tax=Timema douglasi TaxID=61478 RepID=A0A7R8VAH4_TIMDO|nr:unnamed protein product [Timema douglasi]
MSVFVLSQTDEDEEIKVQISVGELEYKNTIITDNRVDRSESGRQDDTEEEEKGVVILVLSAEVFGLIEPFILARSLRAFRISGLGLGEDSDLFIGPHGGGARGERGLVTLPAYKPTPLATNHATQCSEIDNAHGLKILASQCMRRQLYIQGGGDLPKAETIRNVWIPEVNQRQEDNIKDNNASATECLRALVDTITKYEIPYEIVVCVATDSSARYMTKMVYLCEYLVDLVEYFSTLEKVTAALKYFQDMSNDKTQVRALKGNSKKVDILDILCGLKEDHEEFAINSIKAIWIPVSNVDSERAFSAYSNIICLEQLPLYLEVESGSKGTQLIVGCSSKQLGDVPTNPPDPHLTPLKLLPGCGFDQLTRLKELIFKSHAHRCRHLRLPAIADVDDSLHDAVTVVVNEGEGSRLVGDDYLPSSQVQQLPLLLRQNNLSDILLYSGRRYRKEVDEKKVTKTKIVRQHGIPKSTRFTIHKMREEIVNAVQKEGHNIEAKNLKGATHANLEQAIQHRAQNVPINGSMMQRKADEFALRLVGEEAAIHVLPTAASAEDPNDPPTSGHQFPARPLNETAAWPINSTFVCPHCTYDNYIAADDDITIWGTLDDADIIREQQESSDEEGEE